MLMAAGCQFMEFGFMRCCHPGSTSWIKGVGWSKGGKAQPVICVQTTQACIKLLSPLLASKEITLTQGETTGIQWGGVSSIPS